ncbi:MAG: PCRF domain-containing protein [Candidatus Shikimatogenerans sp. JK-2022]|nr:PCRF domain-containing protein [Candidatus Shikimatogenerans bostrichidophilus]
MIQKINLILNNIKKIINIKNIKKKLKNIKYSKKEKKNIILNKKKTKYKKIIKIYKEIFIFYKDFKLLYDFLKKGENNVKNDLIFYKKKIEILNENLYKLIFKKEDELEAIIQINSGAGGNDSCNWAKLLYKMYISWAIKKKFIYKIIDVINTKKGIKYALLHIKGLYSYGYLKGESGIHKLIRISPSNKKRHTSFVSIEVFPYIKKNKKININKKELKFETFKSKGSGGQNVNKVETGVRLIYKPYNLIIRCTITRSQVINKKYAIKILKSKLIILNKKNKKKKPKNKIEWGHHSRTYIMHPYKLIKDLKTGYKTKNFDNILKGNLEEIFYEYIKLSITT